MDLKSRIHGPCGTRKNTLEDIDFNADLFFRRILLFDAFFLKTMRLWEFPHLIRLIGYEAVIQILNNSILKIDCNTSAIAECSVLKANKSAQRKGVIKFGAYSFARIEVSNQEEHNSKCMQCIDGLETLTVKQKKKMKRAIADAFTLPSGEKTEALSNLRQDISNNHPVIKRAIIQTLQKENLSIDPSSLSVRCHLGNGVEDEFEVETNVGDLLKLNEEKTHKVVLSALLGVGTLNQSISNMKAFNALSGFHEHEVPLFDEKLSFLYKYINPLENDQQFSRFISLSGLPDFSSIGKETKFNIDNFLKVRESVECKEFRAWLPTIENVNDKEILDRLCGLQAKVSSQLHSPMGKTIRFLAVTGLGFFGVGKATDIAVGVLDNFLLDKIIPSKGIVTFSHRLYPSIFDKV